MMHNKSEDKRNRGRERDERKEEEREEDRTGDIEITVYQRTNNYARG